MLQTNRELIWTRRDTPAPKATRQCAWLIPGFLFCFALAIAVPQRAFAQAVSDPSAWTVYITNDSCSDYTWGWDEKQTRKAYADVILSHLDEMNRRALRIAIATIFRLRRKARSSSSIIPSGRMNFFAASAKGAFRSGPI